MSRISIQNPAEAVHAFLLLVAIAGTGDDEEDAAPVTAKVFRPRALRWYGSMVQRHRQFVGLTGYEYAVIARCSPAEVVTAEEGEARLPPHSEERLRAYAMPVERLRSLPTGPTTGKGRPGDPWKDIPYDSHARARACVHWRAPMTLDDIGTEMGVCREMVRLIEHRAFQKIRRIDDARGVLRQLWQARAEAINDQQAPAVLDPHRDMYRRGA